MRQIQVEVLRDIMYCTLRQVLRYCGYTVASMRKSYDVVYYQVGTAYHTFSLSKEVDAYVIHHQEQDYSGSIIDSFVYELLPFENLVQDFIECVYYVVQKRVFNNTGDTDGDLCLSELGLIKDDLTCNDCPNKKTCPFAFDPFNTDGDCLALK